MLFEEGVLLELVSDILQIHERPLSLLQNLDNVLSVMLKLIDTKLDFTYVDLRIYVIDYLVVEAVVEELRQLLAQHLR